MSKYDRSVDYIYDSDNEVVIDLSVTITSQKEGFEIRNQYNANTKRFSCVECNQTLVCANSSKDKVYFRHLPKAEYCVLTDPDTYAIQTDNSEISLVEAYKISAVSKESPRHKELKYKIGRLLRKEAFVDVSSIDIDSKFIIGIGGKRRPDVYCEYKGMKLAFEIQLSKLPLHYIKHRYDFYKQNGVYLIWIIDLESVPIALSNFQRDIKYIWKHQNLFCIDDNNDSNLIFKCHYKNSFITSDNTIHDKWNETTVSLENMSFNDKEYFCFYFHYEFEFNRKVDELRQIEEKLELKRREEEYELKKIESTSRVKNIISKIKRYKENSWNFYTIKQEVDNFNYLEIAELNRQVNLNLQIEGLPLILHYIKKYQFGKEENKSSMNIVEFLLTTCNFKFDINVKDNSGKGVMDYLYDNAYFLERFNKVEKFIFFRGYQPTEHDKALLISRYGNFWDSKYFEWTYYSKFNTLNETEKVRDLLSFLLFVESAKKMKIIGSNYKTWVQYITPILDRNKKLHQYFVHVLNNTRLGFELKQNDKKGTIAKRIENYKNEETDSMYYNILVKVHPDIFKDYLACKLP